MQKGPRFGVIGIQSGPRDNLDSSLAARKELAIELNYSGAKDGSAEMNIWLHKAVMKNLAENGGKVPESLKN